MNELCIDIAIPVNEFLISNGLRKGDIRLVDPKYRMFTDEELLSVKAVELTNCYNIEDLIKLPNLTKLYIKSIDYNEIVAYYNYEESQAINHINDFSVISNLLNLEELVIANDLYITSLDISNLKKLNKLILISNPKLKEITGLDKLENLVNVTMYGNDLSVDNFDIKSFVDQTMLSDENTLDISMYLSLIKNNSSIAKDLMNMEISGTSFMRFGEKSGLFNYVCLSLRDLYDMYNSLDMLFKNENVYSMSDEDKILFAYTYVLNNVMFSKELIEKRNIEYQSLKERFGKIPDKYKKTLNNIHSSYYAYYFKKANCEGRVNLLVFMLQMLGIHAQNVHCHDKRSKNDTGSNHSIVRVNLNNDNLYLDPSIIPDAAMDFYLIDFEKMSEYVDLDSYEYSLYLTNSNNKEKEYVIKNNK